MVFANISISFASKSSLALGNQIYICHKERNAFDLLIVKGFWSVMEQNFNWTPQGVL